MDYTLTMPKIVGPNDINVEHRERRRLLLSLPKIKGDAKLPIVKPETSAG